MVFFLERDFYYFLKNAEGGVIEPYRTDEYLGEIGDIVDLDGEKYTIVDYAIDISDFKE